VERNRAQVYQALREVSHFHKSDAEAATGEYDWKHVFLFLGKR
jgi:hypothetical protein